MKVIIRNSSLCFQTGNITKEVFTVENPLTAAGMINISSVLAGKKGVINVDGAGLQEWKLRVDNVSINWSIDNLYAPWFEFDCTNATTVQFYCPIAPVNNNDITITIVEDILVSELPLSFYKDIVKINPNTSTGVSTPGASTANNSQSMFMDETYKITLNDSQQIRVYKYSSQGAFVNTSLITASSVDFSEYGDGIYCVTIPSGGSIVSVEKTSS